MNSGIEPKLLPVKKIAADCIDSVLYNLRFLFAISWLWYVLLFVVSFVFRFLAVATGSKYGGAIAVVPILLVVALMWPSIAVSWHRRMLLRDNPESASMLRLDGFVWRYLKRLVLIFLLLVPLVVLSISGVVILSSEVLHVPFLGFVLSVVFAAYFNIAFYRLGLSLPGIAIGDPPIGFARSWQITRGNNWRYLGILLLLWILVVIVAFVIGLPINALGSRAQSAGDSTFFIVAVVVRILADFFVGLFYAIASIAVLTYCYEFFMGRLEDREMLQQEQSAGEAGPA